MADVVAEQPAYRAQLELVAERRRGAVRVDIVDIAKLALQFSLANPESNTKVSGSANPHNIRNWAHWANQPMDEELLREVQAIFAPVKNPGHVEGLPENN